MGKQVCRSYRYAAKLVHVKLFGYRIQLYRFQLGYAQRKQKHNFRVRIPPQLGQRSFGGFSGGGHGGGGFRGR